MINITDKSNCTGCTACQSICSRNAISMQFDDKGHKYPFVDSSKCIDCGLCDKVCPLQHRDKYAISNEDVPIFAVYNKDTKVRERSTSGGIFTVIADYVINNGGIVYAAKFDSTFKIVHSFTDDIKEIDAFRGSKYAQSDLEGIFRSIKADLEDRHVFFVGTPCQVAGLKSYLLKDYDNLITCDFICMGISSPKIWEEYLDSFWVRKRIKRIIFKDKRYGWHAFKMLVEDNLGEHLITTMEDPFFSCYLTHLTYRESCFSCPFRHISRVSDFTISDCWGIDKYNPDFDDNKGCSTLFLQSNKAKTIFENIKEHLNYIPYPIEMVKKNNPYSISPITRDPDTEIFYVMRQSSGIKAAFKAVSSARINRYRFSMLKKIKNKLKRFLLWNVK